MSKIVACPDNQAAFDHLSLVASRCLGGKREQYRFSLLKAMKSLKLYPLPIESIEEALSLDGVGPALAKEVMKGIATFKSGNKTQEKEIPFDNPSDGEVRVKAKSSKVDRSVLGVVGASPLPKRSKPCISDLSFTAAMTQKSRSEISFATEIFDSPRKDVPDGDNTSLSDKSLRRREKIINSNIVSLQIDRSDDIPSSSPEKVWNVIQDAIRCKKSKRDSIKTAWSKSEMHSLYLEIPESPCMIRSSCTNSGGRDVYSDIKNDSGKAELNRDEHQNKNIKNDTVISLAKNSAESPTDSDIIDVSKSNQYFDLTQDDYESNVLGKFRLLSDEKSVKKIDIQNDLSDVKSNEGVGYHNKHVNVVDINDTFACRRHSRKLLDRENNEENKMDNYQHCTDAGDFDGMRKVASNRNTYSNKSQILNCNNIYQSAGNQKFRNDNDNNNCKDNYTFTENDNYDGYEYDYHTYDDYDNFDDTYNHNDCKNSNYDVTETDDGNNNDNDNDRNDTKIYSDNDKIITSYKICTKIIDKNIRNKYANNFDRIHGSSTGDDDDDSSVDMDFNKGRKSMNKKDQKVPEEGNKISKITISVQDKTIDYKMKEDEKKNKKGKSEHLKSHFTDKYEHNINKDEGSKLFSNYNDLKSPKAQRKREHNYNKISYQEEPEMTDGKPFFPNRAFQKELSSIVNHPENSSLRDNLDYVTHSKEERESKQEKGEIEEERHREVFQIHDIDDEDGSNKECLLEQLKGRGGNRKNKEIKENVENNLFALKESYDKSFTEGKTKKDEKIEKKKDKITVKKKDNINEGVKKKTPSLLPSTYKASITDAEIEIEIVINDTDNKPTKKLKKSIISPVEMKINEKSENSKNFKAALVNTVTNKSDVGLTIGKKQSSSQALSKFDVSRKKIKENNENIYGNINFDLESQKLSVKQKSSFSDNFAIDSSDEEEAENRPDIDDLPFENSPVIDPFLSALLGDINDWEPVLMVDVREKDHNLIQNRMLEMGIACEVQLLSLGDFLWAARRKKSYIEILQNVEASKGLGLITNWMISNSQPTQKEMDRKKKEKEKMKKALEEKEALLNVVLECVVERKTSADLASSIIDGRYNEQKHRLQECGLRNCIYIVEGLSLSASKHSCVSNGALKTALVTTQVGYGLQVVRTRGIDHTISYLQAMHRQICLRFYSLKCGPMYLPFSEFQKRWARKAITTVGEAFTLMLREIPGCSLAAATALSVKYLTIANMDQRFTALGPQAAQDEMADVRKSGITGQRIGSAVASQIYKQLYEIF